MPIKSLLEWELCSQRLADYFVKKYFGKSADWYWIADEVGGTIEVNDFFFDINDIADFIRNKYTTPDLLAFYQELSDNNFERKASIKYWKQLKKIKDKI